MARAATVSLRALPLRRVLLVIVCGFVLVPLLVYNVATLDLRSARASSHAFFRAHMTTTAVPSTTIKRTAGVSTPLPRCLNVSSAALLTPDGRARIARECVADSYGSTAAPEAAARVHYVHVALTDVPLLAGERAPALETVAFAQHAAVQSVRKFAAPSVMVLHYVAKPPRGVWYTQCQRHLSLHRVLAPDVEGLRSGTSDARMSVAQRRKLMAFVLMLRALFKQGGTAFSDFSTVVLRETLQHSRALGAVVASHAAPRDSDAPGSFRINLHALQAPAQHPLLQDLERALLTRVARNDASLYDRPLEALVGELVRNASATYNGSLVVADAALFDGLSPSALAQLPKTRVSDASTHALAGVSAFHIDLDVRIDSHQTLADLSTDDVLDGDSVVHALLRFATDLNATAEVDAHLER